MEEVFLVLFLVSFLVMVIGLINPNWFKTLPEDKRNRKSIAMYFGIAAVVFFILFEMTAPVVENDSLGKNEKIEMKNTILSSDD